ncbi:MAG: phage-related major capsid protein [Frankiales bacterium]|nr:phage-related major capsid protein [Frankiales bacterium]
MTRTLAPTPRLERLNANRAGLIADATAIVDQAERARRDLTPEEARRFDALLDRARSLDDEAEREQAREAREVRAAAARSPREASMTYSPARITNEPSTYRRGDPSASYFRDLYEARTNGSREAVDRLVRNDKENRALSNTGQTSTIGAGAGAGGEFAPPLWLIDDFVALARPARVMADRFTHEVLPSGVANINLPRVATGTTTAVQSTQNSALSQTDLTSNQVSSSITTIGGKQIVSMQLLQQSGLNFDRVILGDLAADYARALDTQVLSGSGAAGQLRGVTAVATGGNAITYTDASPAVAGAGKFYAQVAKAMQAIGTTRFMPATAIVMHPRRWAWITASFDTQNRPLVVPSGQGINVASVAENAAAQGLVGEMLGLPVYADPNITITDGTNQDIVYVLAASDLWLWESPIQAEAFTATYADSMGVLFRLFAYSASIPDRYPASVATIRGTGLVTPTF